MAKKAARKRTTSVQEMSEKEFMLLREQQQQTYALAAEKSNRLFSLLTTVVWGFVIVGGAYVGIYLPIKASSGQETTISYVVKVISDFRAEIWLSWAVSAGCAGWARWEYKKRLKERAEKDKRIEDLESQIDPDRTSSQMTPEGEIKNE